MSKRHYLSRNFPQISRSIPAHTIIYSVKLMVLVLLIFFLTTLFLYPPSGFEMAKLGVLLLPNDLSNHLLLVQEYLGRGDMTSVERELILTSNFTNSTKRSDSPSSPISPNFLNVLGASTLPAGRQVSPLKILEKIKAEPQRINEEISFWEKVVANKPNYRDGYLRLALLNAQIYETQKAKNYLEKAKTLDPNFEAVKKLEELLKTF